MDEVMSTLQSDLAQQNTLRFRHFGAMLFYYGLEFASRSKKKNLAKRVDQIQAESNRGPMVPVNGGLDATNSRCCEPILKPK
jgi:hypothetical protein